MKKNDLAVGLAIGMTCGLVIGAVAGVLLAPASGAETRRRLRFEGDNAIDATKLRARRLARVRRARPGEEVEAEEEGAFWGA